MNAFVNANIYVEGQGIVRTSLTFDTKIKTIGDDVIDVDCITLPEDAVVLPGFIDQHIHGAGGADAMDGTTDALATIANTIAAEGTTTFLATTMTQSPENILRAMAAVRNYRTAAPETGARLLGVHLEGPFIAAAHKGAQSPEYVATPDIAVFDRYNAASGNAIRIVSLAPEETDADALVAHLAKNGIVPSIGHTGAKCADVRRAIHFGAKNVTHTYNAQSPLHHREIGTVGSALLYDSLNNEVICDTIHVSVPALQLLVKCKPQDKVTLITDAMRAKGLADGESELGGQKVFVQNGEARLADGTLAGSVLRMNAAIANMVEHVGVPFRTAVDFATANPAKNLGLYDTMGSIRLGKNADFAVLDSKYNVLLTIRDGVVIYRA